MVIHQFTTAEPNPPFAEMRRDMYADYCFDCSCEGLEPIDWHTWKVLVSELLAKHKDEAWFSAIAHALLIAGVFITAGVFETARRKPNYFGGLGRGNGGEHE